MMQTQPGSERPLTTLPPRGRSLRQRILATLGFLMFAGFLVAMMVYTLPPLLSDWQIHDTAEPAGQGHIVKGSCTTKIVFAICDLTLSNRTGAGTVTRSVNYAFTDLHFGDYRAETMADPAHPELITTDLGLDRLWNRTLTFLAVTMLMLAIVTLPIVALFRNRHTATAA